MNEGAAGGPPSAPKAPLCELADRIDHFQRARPRPGAAAPASAACSLMLPEVERQLRRALLAVLHLGRIACTGDGRGYAKLALSGRQETVRPVRAVTQGTPCDKIAVYLEAHSSNVFAATPRFWTIAPMSIARLAVDLTGPPPSTP